MNSAEEISTYNDNNSHYCSPVLARKNGNSYSFPEKSPKKDKKWSFGSLFRRKKKESDSSSDDESQSRNFLQKKKKKPDKRKRVNNASGFDHVVVPLPARQNHTNGGKNYEDSLGILSEPIMLRNNFIPASDFTNRFVPLKDNHDCLNRNELNRSNNSLGSPSVSSLGRRKKGYVKARAEARRDTSKGEESSDDDDDSQLSAFRSDDSLSKPRDGSSSRRSRAARTQRYLRRRSKDDELRDHIKITKADTHENSRNLQHALLEDERIEIRKSAIKSPILSAPKSKLCYTNSAPPSRPNFSGLTTIPPSHSSHSRYRTVGFPNGMSNKHLSYYASYNDTGNKFATDFNNQRSLSCESNMHNTSTSPDVVNGVLPIFQPFNKTTNVLVNNAIRKNPPPPPPPRDPRRIITVQSGEARPISYSFENGYKTKVTTDHNMNKQIPDSNQNFLNHNFRSTSEDHISTEPLQRIPVIARPSSATTEMNRLHKMNRNNSESDEKPTGYRYLTDKNPRSRKPICIQAEAAEQPTWSQKTFNFWKRKDDEISRNNNNRKSTAPSPFMFTAQTHVTTNIFLPNSVETLATTNVDSAKRDGSPFRPIASPKVSSPDAEEVKRKSSNLEDALDELEAIYNSLHLGDEDLLDRAEKRETAAAQKLRDAAFESFPDTIARGTINDSSFGFDPNFDSTRKKRSSKKSEPNIKTDDMAFRKLNRERYNTTTDAQSAISNMSYLLTSPVFNSPVDEIAQPKVKSDEPDVTFDDVVFRNVMRTNNMLKVVDPQPPFGIPMGPISPASNSDYLHATPEPTEKFAHSSKKIPDVVKDDLAYRSLRKDANKGSALPQSYISEEYFNNDKFEGFRKKRAVRSLSANIGNLMHKNDAKPMISITTDYDSEQNITDVADALEIARQILRDKEEKINATRQAFMSDGELKYRRFDSTSPTDHRTLFMNEMKSISSNNNENLYQHKLQVTIPDYDRLDSKPPTPDRRGSKASTKESTPIPSSPPEDSELQKQLRQSTLDDLLTSLAVETRETSDKITEELNLIGSDSKLRQICDYDKDVNWNSKLTNESCESCVQNPKRDLEESSIGLKVDDDSTLEHVKLCEKLLQCVATNKELLAANTEELELSEEVAKIDPIPEIVANIVLLPTDRSKLEINPVATEVFSESDHDYVNIQSADETEKDREIEDILLNGSRAQELSASFTERNGTTAEDNADLLAAFEVVDETLRKMNIGGSNKGDCLNIEQTDKGGGETCFSVEYIALPTKGCAYIEKSQYDFNIFDENGDESKAQNFVTEICYQNNNNISETETKRNFKIGGEVDNSEVDRDLRNEESLESLKSPKLVKHLSENYKRSEERQNFEHKPEDCLRSGADGTKNICDSTMIDSNSSNLRDSRHTLDGTQPSCAWYENPGVIALACSFGVACTTQLPTLDIIAVLGLLFAIISLLLALLARI